MMPDQVGVLTASSTGLKHGNQVKSLKSPSPGSSVFPIGHPASSLTTCEIIPGQVRQGKTHARDPRIDTSFLALVRSRRLL
jgi:hypothetical protein